MVVLTKQFFLLIIIFVKPILCHYRTVTMIGLYKKSNNIAMLLAL